MATITCFEDIEAWKKGRKLTKNIYSITSAGRFAKDYSLRDQMRKASVSIISNIAEGFERGGTREFLQFLAMAKGSVGEVKSQLYVALDQGYIQEKSFDSLYALASESGKMIAGLMNYLGRSKIKGSKYKSTRN